MTRPVFEVLLGDKTVAYLERTRPTCFRLTYTEEGLADPRPISKSIRKDESHHTMAEISPWLLGYLPEYLGVRSNISGMSRMSDDPYLIRPALWTKFMKSAKDLSGAIHFKPQGEVETPYVAPLDSLEDVVEALGSGWDERGYTSNLESYVAGVAPKLSLAKTSTGWGRPYGGEPSTHILKLGTRGLFANVLNEAVCLRLATLCGFSAVEPELIHAKGKWEGDIWGLLSPRFDRRGKDRIHAETLCQALGYEPERKYQVSTPSALKALCDPEEKKEFAKRLALFYLLDAGDMHGANWTIMHSEDGSEELSPIYDLWSAYPYVYSNQMIRLAMQIGNENRPFCLIPEDIKRLGEDINMSEDEVLDMFAEIACDVRKNLAPSFEYVKDRYPEGENLLNRLDRFMTPSVMSASERVETLIDADRKARAWDGIAKEGRDS